MKKSINIIGLVTAFVMTSCAIEEGFEVNSYQSVDFDVSAATAGVIEVFVLEEDGFQAIVPVNLGAKASSDITVSVEIIEELIDDSNELAQADVHYSNFPSSITIPAGETQANFAFDALFDGFASASETRELNMRITGVSGGNAEIFENDTIGFLMQKYTPLVLADFVGTFDVNSTSVFDGAPYSYTVTTVINGTNDGLIVSTLGSGEAIGGRPVASDVDVIFVDEPGNAQISFESTALVGNTTACGVSEPIQFNYLGSGTFNAAAITFSGTWGMQVSCGSFEVVNATVSKQVP